MLLAYCIIRLSSFRSVVPTDDRLGPRCGGVLLHIEGGHLQAKLLCRSTFRLDITLTERRAIAKAFICSRCFKCCGFTDSQLLSYVLCNGGLPAGLRAIHHPIISLGPLSHVPCSHISYEPGFTFHIQPPIPFPPLRLPSLTGSHSKTRTQQWAPYNKQ